MSLLSAEHLLEQALPAKSSVVVSSAHYPSGHGSIEYLASGRKDGPPILLLNEVDVPVFVSISTFFFRCDHARSGLSASCIGAVTSNKE